MVLRAPEMTHKEALVAVDEARGGRKKDVVFQILRLHLFIVFCERNASRF